MAWAMCCSITVLPALGGDTISPRWPLPIGGDDVDDAAGQILLGPDVALEDEGEVGVERGEVLEQDLVLGVFRRLRIDLVHLHQREVALAVLGRSDLALDRIPGVQIEAPDLATGSRKCRRARPGRTYRASAGSRSRPAAPPACPRRRCSRLSWPGSSAARRSGPACAGGWHSRSRWRSPSPRVRSRGGS